MNEPLYINSFICEESTTKAYYTHFYFTSSKNKTMHILTPILLVLCILSAIPNLTFIYICLGAYLFLCICFCLSYRRAIKTDIARNKEISNGAPYIKELLVFDDKIIQNSPNGSMSIWMENIKEAEATKNYIYVVTKSNFCIKKKKDSFTLGNAEDFIEFLKSKGIKVQK